MEMFKLILSILTILTILLLALYYKLVLKPKNQLKHIHQQFIKNNWKVLDIGFIPFDTQIRSNNPECTKLYNDCFYNCKSVWSQYDATICNFVDRPFIQLINPSLAK